MLDLIHRIYEADESFRLDFIVHSKLYLSHIVVQIGAGEGGADCVAGFNTGVDAGRGRSHADLRGGRLPDADRNFCDALERGDWRVTFLYEFFGMHHLPNGVGRAGRLAGCDRTHHSALRDTVAAGKVASTLTEDRGSLPS
jgi:hypothetical protein